MLCKPNGLQSGSGNKVGQYIWKQFTTKGGDFLGYVTSDKEDKFPNDGELNGKYYLKTTTEPEATLYLSFAKPVADIGIDGDIWVVT